MRNKEVVVKCYTSDSQFIWLSDSDLSEVGFLQAAAEKMAVSRATVQMMLA